MQLATANDQNNRTARCHGQKRNKQREQADQPTVDRWLELARASE
jgi:hypothetical protein